MASSGLTHQAQVAHLGVEPAMSHPFMEMMPTFDRKNKISTNPNTNGTNLNIKVDWMFGVSNRYAMNTK